MSSKIKLVMAVNFSTQKFFNEVPDLVDKYTSNESRKKTVTILGSATNSKALEEYMDMCAEVTEGLVKNGYNILSGCGSHGIMGTAYEEAKKHSAVDMNGRPIQNLTILVEPGWGDEDLKHCVPIGKAKSEAERIDKFFKTSDNFVIFPGGSTTLQEATSLINFKKHLEDSAPVKKIILVGKDFFDGLLKQYETIFRFNPDWYKPPESLFKILNTPKEILKEFPKLLK